MMQTLKSCLVGISTKLVETNFKITLSSLVKVKNKPGMQKYSGLWDKAVEILSLGIFVLCYIGARYQREISPNFSADVCMQLYQKPV